MSNKGVFDPRQQETQSQGLDLSAVRTPARNAGAGAQAGAPAGAQQQAQPAQDPNTVNVPALVFDVDEQSFEAVVQLSTQVPVVIDLWAEWCGPCKQLSPVIEKVTRDYDGQVVLAKIDVDKNPRIQQAFGVQSIPTVVALVKGQPVPLFQGATPEPQVKQLFDQLLAAAAQAGVNKRAVTGEATQQPAGPKHPEAIEALEAGDLDRAAQVYQDALNETPGDEEAKSGLPD
ncbi:thioredoxin [Brevibacterium paucivorans]